MSTKTDRVTNCWSYKYNNDFHWNSRLGGVWPVNVPKEIDSATTEA